MDDEAFRVPKLEVLAFIVVPENKLTPRTLLFRVMSGVVPPEEEILPEPVTETTEPLPTVVVAIIMPFWSKAKTFPAETPVRKVCPVVVELVTIDEEAFRLVKVEVEAFKKPVAQRLASPTLLFRLTVLPPLMLMLVPANTEVK